MDLKLTSFSLSQFNSFFRKELLKASISFFNQNHSLLLYTVALGQFPLDNCPLVGEQLPQLHRPYFSSISLKISALAILS